MKSIIRNIYLSELNNIPLTGKMIEIKNLMNNIKDFILKLEIVIQEELPITKFYYNGEDCIFVLFCDDTIYLCNDKILFKNTRHIFYDYSLLHIDEIVSEIFYEIFNIYPCEYRFGESILKEKWKKS